jgi:gamma-glutamylcyclotransferase (GGCT)/AIG2-like uncharacterized protein YtfP
MSDLLFIYGTLLPGQAPAGMEAVCRCLRPRGEATVAGRLYDLGHYPGAILDGDSLIQGQLVAVDSDQTWRALDRYEGCPREGEGDGLFRRVRTTATLGDGERVECWIYVYDRDPGHAPAVAGGCWNRSRG